MNSRACWWCIISDAPDALPFGPFDPLEHRTLESGLRSWVSEQTYLDLGYAEQLYTFGDRGRHLVKSGEGPRVVSVGYLALTRGGSIPKAPDTMWRDWYGFFPWEDWRAEKPAIIDAAIVPALKTFADAARQRPARLAPRTRARGVRVWRRRLGRRKDARALRASLRSRARRGSRARWACEGDAPPERPLGSSMPSIIVAFWPPRSRDFAER